MVGGLVSPNKPLQNLLWSSGVCSFCVLGNPEIEGEWGGVVYLQASLPLGWRGTGLPWSGKHEGWGVGGISGPGPSWSDATPGPSALQSDLWLALGLGHCSCEPATC